MKLITPESFLSQVWPKNLLKHETLELRAIRRKDNSIRRQFLLSIDEFLSAANTYGEGYDIYFGVSTRFAQGGTKKDCYRVQCLWVDLDHKKLPDFGKLPPNIIVYSGTGCHLYWLLENPIFIRTERHKEIEAINRAICKKFGGDIAAIDVTRILRVPGFSNHKYDPPKEVKAYGV